MITILSRRVASKYGSLPWRSGHSMTSQQKRVRPITLLFEVGFYNYLTERIINGKIHVLMIFKDIFEGPVGDYCYARNTIKCLFILVLRYSMRRLFFRLTKY